MRTDRARAILHQLDNHPITKKHFDDIGIEDEEVYWLIRTGYLEEVSTGRGKTFYSLTETGQKMRDTETL